MSSDHRPPTAAALAHAPSALPPPPGPIMLLDVRNTPVPLKLTWSRDAMCPAAICLRRDIKVLDLLKFTAKADLTLPAMRLICGFSCKDTIFNGRLSLNVPVRAVEYSKKFLLPNGTGLVVSAGMQHRGGSRDLTSSSLRHQFHPMLSAQLSLGSGGSGNVVFSGNAFNCKQRVPIPRRWICTKYPRFELQTYTAIKVPQLMTRYSLQRDGHRSGFPDTLGEERQEQGPLHLHVAAFNIVIRL